VAAFGDRFGREPGTYAAYGYASMQLVLNAIATAGGGDSFRGDIRDSVLNTGEHESPLGRFAIDQNGDTTLCAGQGC
jgi:branched-chain amino acid transport system substrate-binding protein